MAEQAERSEFQKRLRRLPGQLALALVNATAVLIIAAGIITIVAVGYLENSAAAISASVTRSVLSSAGIDGDQIGRSVKAFDDGMRDLRKSFEDGGSKQADKVLLQIDGLTQTLKNLQTSVDRLVTAKTQLSDASIRQAGHTLTDSLLRLRNCQPVTGSASAAGQFEQFSARTLGDVD